MMQPTSLPAALRAAQACRYLIYTQRPILRFLFPQGRHAAPMGVKFGTEEGTKKPLLHAKFHPHRCNDKGVGPPKLKFLLRFDQNVEYKRPRRGVSLARFSQNSQSLYLISGCVGVKILLDLLKQLWSYGGLSWGCLVAPKFSAPPSGETMRQTPNVSEVQERARGPLSPCQVWGARISPAAGVAKNV